MFESFRVRHIKNPGSLSWDFFVWHSGDPKPVFDWLPERSGALVLKGGILLYTLAIYIADSTLSTDY